MAKTSTPDETPKPTCAHCGRPITTEYLHALAVVSGTRAAPPKVVLDLPETIGLCHDCASSGIALTVQLQWRGVGE